MATVTYLSQQAVPYLTELGIETRVIDLRWLAPLPADSLLKALEGANKVLIVDECRRTGGQAEALPRSWPITPTFRCPPDRRGQLHRYRPGPRGDVAVSPEHYRRRQPSFGVCDGVIDWLAGLIRAIGPADKESAVLHKSSQVLWIFLSCSV